jgi:hypothetical protein
MALAGAEIGELPVDRNLLTNAYICKEEKCFPN